VAIEDHESLLIHFLAQDSRVEFILHKLLLKIARQSTIIEVWVPSYHDQRKVLSLMTDQHPWGGILYASITISLWSLSAFFSTNLRRISPLLLVGIAFTIAGLMGIRHIRSWKAPAIVFLIGVGSLFGYQVLYFLAFQNGPSIEVNLINYLWPLLIVVLSPFYLKGYSLQWNHIAGALAGLLGVGFIVSSGKLNFNFTAASGYFYAASAAVIWASYSLLMKRFLSLPTSIVSGFCFFAGLLALAVFFAGKPVLPDAIQLTWKEWLFVVLMGIGPHGIAFVTWSLALKKGDPRTIGTFSYLTPVLSTLILTVTGTGHLSLASGLGLLLIITGILAGSMQIRRPVAVSARSS